MRMEVTQGRQSSIKVIQVIGSIADSTNNLSTMPFEILGAMAQIKMAEVGLALREAEDQPEVKRNMVFNCKNGNVLKLYYIIA